MSIRISSGPDESGHPLCPVRDKIDDALRSHPAVRLAVDAVPYFDRIAAKKRFGPVRLIERDTETAVVFACGTTRWVVVQTENVLESTILLGVPNPRIGFDRSFRSSFLERLTIHQTGASSSNPHSSAKPPEVAWMSLSGIAAEGVAGFEVRTSVDADSGVVDTNDGFVLAVLRARWNEKPAVVVTLTSGQTVRIHHPSLLLPQ